MQGAEIDNGPFEFLGHVPAGAFQQAPLALGAAAQNVLGIHFASFRYDDHISWLGLVPLLRDWFDTNRLALLAQLGAQVGAGRRRHFLFRMQWHDTTNRTSGTPFMSIRLGSEQSMHADLNLVVQRLVENENNDPESAVDIDDLELVEFQYVFMESDQFPNQGPPQHVQQLQPIPFLNMPAPPLRQPRNARIFRELDLPANRSQIRLGLRSMARQLRNRRAGGPPLLYRHQQVPSSLKNMWFRKHKCIRQVKGDGLCLFRCFVVADFHSKKQLHHCLQNSARQTEAAVSMAQELCVENGIVWHGDMTSLPPLAEIVNWFDCNVIVWEWRSVLQQGIHRPSFTSVLQDEKKTIHLMWDPDQEHVDWIVDPKKLFGHKYECPECMACFSTQPYRHVCVDGMFACPYCHQEHDDELQLVHPDSKYCDECGRTCYDASCFDKHKQNQQCSTSYYCAICDEIFARSHIPRQEHKCGSRRCARCRLDYDLSTMHYCTMPTLKNKTLADNRKYAAYDFETTPDTNQMFQVNLAMFVTLDDPTLHTFDSIDAFCRFILVDHLQWYRGYTFVAHCGSRFDAQFVLDWCVKQGYAPKVISNGRQLFSLEIKDVRWIDSSKFMATSLDGMAKSLGVEMVEKGCFPHSWNRPEKYNYKGSWPPLEAYDIGMMKPSQAKKVKLFWEEHKDQEFDFNKEFTKYCESDVRVLAECVRKFQSQFRALDVDPYAHSTIAGAAMHSYRVHFMPTHLPRAICTLKYNADMQIRQALYGGRTEVFYQKYHCQPNEKIVNLDVVSMYPSVMLTEPYPMGEPVWLMNPFDWYATNKFGVMHCDIDPPQNVSGVKRNWLPVLPHRRDGKLFFDLKSQKNVWHATPELRKAHELGYIVKPKGMYWWKETTTELFRKYILYWFEKKIQFGGWPKGRPLEKHRRWFLEELKVRFKIDLKYEQVNDDEAMKQVAKIMLNSLWGKFGQNPVRVETQFINDTDDMMDLINNMDQQLLTLRPIGTDVIEVRTKPTANQLVRNPPTSTCVSLAVFTTAHARLRLWSEAQRLGFERIVYCDTDSLYVIEDEEGPKFEFGDHLGDWSRELPPQEYIKNFVALSPKFYAYQVFDTEGNRVKEQFRAKGIALNVADREILTYQAYEQMVADPALELKSGPQLSISITPAHQVKIIPPLTKILRASQQPKRFFYLIENGNLFSRPFVEND